MSEFDQFHVVTGKSVTCTNSTLWRGNHWPGESERGKPVRLMYVVENHMARTHESYIPPQLISRDYHILHRTMHDMYMQRLYEMKPTQYHNTFPEWHRQNNVNHKIISDEHAWGPLNGMTGTDHTQCTGDMDQGGPKRLESQLPRFL